MKEYFSKTINERGITLITLVITIIILIILATVTINGVFGDNGLIKQAEYARDLSSNATESEYESMNSLYEEYINMIEEDNENIDENRTLAEWFDSGQLNIGDYVDYKNPESGTYTANAVDTGIDNAGIGEITNQVFDVTKNQLNWRVLGKDETTGGIKLIAGSPVKSENIVNGQSVPYLFMYGAKAYINGNDILNNIGELYKNEYASSARSINMNDIDEITGITNDEKIKEVNMDAYLGNRQYGESYSFENQYTPESWINGKQQITVSGTVNGYYYTINSEQDNNAPTVKMSNNRAYEMLFYNTEIKGKQYWLASRGVYAGAGNAGFGQGRVYTEDAVSAGIVYMFASYNEESLIYAAVRPVVILKPEITLKQVPKISDQIEEEWNYEYNNS